LNPQKFTIFYTDGVSGVKNFKYNVFRNFTLRLWSDQSEFMALFMVFVVWCRFYY